MNILKIPKLERREYDRIIEEGYISRIAFRGDEFPYIAPFLYVFDGKYLHFLSTKYGRKIEYFRANPSVSVEIEQYAQDLSAFQFISLQGRLEEIGDPTLTREIRKKFVDMIRSKRLSPVILSALGHSPSDTPDVIAREERTLVWRLVGVKDIVALRNA